VTDAPDDPPDRFGPYANDAIAAGLVVGFLGYVAVIAARGPAAAGADAAPPVLVHGWLLAVSVAVTWVFGQETVRAVGLLTTAVRSPDDVVGAGTAPQAPDAPGDGAESAAAVPAPDEDGPDPEPEADHGTGDGSTAQRHRMIRTQTPGLDAGLGTLLTLSLPATFLLPALPPLRPLPVVRVTPSAGETLANLTGAPDLVLGAWVVFSAVAAVWAFGVQAALTVAELRRGR
jgi:hypothetical protein